MSLSLCGEHLDSFSDLGETLCKCCIWPKGGARLNFGLDYVLWLEKAFSCISQHFQMPIDVNIG